ncbi:MAG: SDR family oxidoreductase [Pseudomonadota bacterium]
MPPIQSLDLTSKTALITGASKGIGLAAAQVLSSYGANVVLAARRTQPLEEAAAALRETGAQAAHVTLDVTEFSSFQNAVQTSVNTFGRIDALINNAGTIDPIAHLIDSDPGLWASAVDTNLKGVYFGMRAVLPIMREQGAGRVINISSGAANSKLEGWSHYCATKAAAKRLTEIAHKELDGSGVHVIGLSPGTVATNMMEKIKASGMNPVSQIDWSKHIPPTWVGEAIAYLCGPNGAQHAGTDFSIKTPEGREMVGLPSDDLG